MLGYLYPSLKSTALEKKGIGLGRKSCELELSSHGYSRSLEAVVSKREEREHAIYSGSPPASRGFHLLMIFQLINYVSFKHWLDDMCNVLMSNKLSN